MKNLLIIILVLFTTTIVYASNNSIQNFLVRSNYLSSQGGIAKANNYRVQRYTMIRPTTFMGKHVMLNKRVHKSLQCVENRIKSSCSDSYQPKALSGWRASNTYKGQELSNHIFGIAIDIDPMDNPCCGCIGNWSKSERCKGDGVIEHENGAVTGNYELPECWVDAFKSNGWHWLGDDAQLRDTMHFEYLADPDQKIECH